MSGTLVSDPLAAGLAVALGRNALEHILDVRPRLLISTRHDAGAISGALLTTRNTGADKADALGSQVLGTAVGVREVGVAAVNDDVALLDTALVQKELDEVYSIKCVSAPKLGIW